MRATAQVLDELARLDLVQKQRAPGGDVYRLTVRAIPYFYTDNQFGNNVTGASYLCYSSIVPQRVVWNDAIHVERVARDAHEAQVFRAAFEWSPSPAAAWAADPFIRSHSVILSPAPNLVVATLVKHDSEWQVERLHTGEPSLPRVVDASVWPHLPR